VLRFAVAAGYPAERAVLLPNAFDPPDVPSADRVSDVRRRYGIGGGPYLFFAGDITYNKGVYDLLRAYGRWRPGNPLVRLVLAGSNREGKRFLDQVPHDGSVVYTGHVPHSDVLAMMRGAEVVVLPSRSEGLPTVILEAIALGTKVICPPGIPEFERHLAQFVLPRVDEGAIVDALNAAWHSGVVPSYPLSEHSVSRVVEALVEVYDQVLRERSVPAPASGGWHADRSG
jgi:glycosyltransferase involved in cell wall biosynthesis